LRPRLAFAVAFMHLQAFFWAFRRPPGRPRGGGPFAWGTRAPNPGGGGLGVRVPPLLPGIVRPRSKRFIIINALSRAFQGLRRTNYGEDQSIQVHAGSTRRGPEGNLAATARDPRPHR